MEDLILSRSYNTPMNPINNNNEVYSLHFTLNHLVCFTERRNKRVKKRTLTRREMEALQDGEELHEALESDPTFPKVRYAFFVLYFILLCLPLW